MKTRCAITGSNGYVGGRLKNYFAARGWEILELTRQPKPGTRCEFHFNWARIFLRRRSLVCRRSCIAPTISSRCGGRKSAR